MDSNQDDYFFDLMVKEVKVKRKVGGTFTTLAW
ncbi:hypothetical protein AMTRI_Chr03g46960 [Amborella trichopoda]